MIRLNDDYVILVDSHNYTLARDTHRTGKCFGKPTPIFKDISYHNSVSNALKALGKEIIKEELSKEYSSLTAATLGMETAIKRFEEIVDEKFPEYEVVRK